MLGLSLAYLPTGSLREAADAFFALQAEFPLRAAELHMEGVQFPAAFWYWDRSADEVVAEVRSRVDVLGVHLPYLDMNPISPNPRMAGIALAAHKAAISRAASMHADYVVFHARGHHGLEAHPDREIECWTKVTASLADAAAHHGVRFCFENADDVRLIRDVERILKPNPGASLCLDIGHLYERMELPRVWERAAARLSDKLLPGRTLVRKGIPLHEAGGIESILDSLRDRVSCVHLHSHDGRTAHAPVSLGRRDMQGILSALEGLRGIPIIIEADYRRLGMDQLRKDISILEQFTA